MQPAIFSVHDEAINRTELKTKGRELAKMIMKNARESINMLGSKTCNEGHVGR